MEWKRDPPEGGLGMWSDMWDSVRVHGEIHALDVSKTKQMAVLDCKRELPSQSLGRSDPTKH